MFLLSNSQLCASRSVPYYIVLVFMYMTMWDFILDLIILYILLIGSHIVQSTQSENTHGSFSYFQFYGRAMRSWVRIPPPIFLWVSYSLHTLHGMGGWTYVRHWHLSSIFTLHIREHVNGISILWELKLLGLVTIVNYYQFQS